MTDDKVSDSAIPNRSRLDLFTKVAGVAVLIYAYLFFAGWVYVTSLYGEFGLDPYTVDIPTYTFPNTAVLALQRIFVYILGFALLLIVISVVLFGNSEVYCALARPFPRCKVTLDQVLSDLRGIPDASGIPKWLAALLFWVLLFPGTLAIANVQGINSAREAWGTGTHIRLVFKNIDKQTYEPELLQANEGGRLSIFTQTKDLVIVFETRTKTARQKNVFLISRADLTSVRIWW